MSSRMASRAVSKLSRSSTGVRYEEVQKLPSKSLTTAANRGASTLEKQASWPFDYYQAGEFYPVDYQYWWTPYKTSCGKTQLTMLHAIAYADDGSTFAADQLDHRGTIRAMHRLANQAYVAQTSLRYAGRAMPPPS